MSTIERQLPRTNDNRLTALNKAKDKNDNLPVGTVIITPATENRLDIIQPVYLAKVNLLSVAVAMSTQATANKNTAQAVSKMWTSHYYQALNNAIERGVYPQSVRAFYNLDVSSNAVPDMITEDDIKLWGERVSSGETAMIAAGHAAIPFPSEPGVKAKVDDYKAKLIAQSTAMDATDAAQEVVNAQNTEADKVIKKVWDEVETHHNEETPESMRANATEWGVVYVTIGDPTAVTFKAVRSDNGAAIQDVEFKIKSTGKIHVSDDADSVTFETRIIGDEIATATHALYQPLEKTFTVVEGQAMTVTFTMVPL